MDKELTALTERVAEVLLRGQLTLAVAESCTGGWIAKVLTDLPGSSRWFERGFVTYSNTAKREMLGVAGQTLERYGAVSEETVREMACGALARSHGQIGVAVSGIAGPGGAVPGKPVGTVCFAWALEGGDVVTRTRYLEGDREAVRRESVRVALDGVLDVLE